MSALLVREATAADAEGIRELFARAFGREMSADEWRWKYAENPDGWFGTVAVLAGRIVGNYSGSGARFLVGGEERRTFAVGDVATDPSVRGLGGRRNAFRRMTEAFYEEVEGRRGAAFCFGFPGERHLVLSQRIVGTRTVFSIVQKRVPCEAFPPPPNDAASGDFADESFDPLWEAASRAWPALAVRDRARANWRFHARPDRYYRMVWRVGTEGLAGWAVLSVSGETALVADFLGRADDGSDLEPLFAAAASEASRLHARRLVFWETPGPGSAVIAKLPGERVPTGFPLDARGRDGAALDVFRAHGHLVPALYDVV